MKLALCSLVTLIGTPWGAWRLYASNRRADVTLEQRSLTFLEQLPSALSALKALPERASEVEPKGLKDLGVRHAPGLGEAVDQVQADQGHPVDQVDIVVPVCASLLDEPAQQPGLGLGRDLVRGDLVQRGQETHCGGDARDVLAHAADGTDARLPTIVTASVDQETSDAVVLPHSRGEDAPGLQPEVTPAAVKAGEARRAQTTPCHECDCCAAYATRLRDIELELERVRDDLLWAEGTHVGLADNARRPSQSVLA